MTLRKWLQEARNSDRLGISARQWLKTLTKPLSIEALRMHLACNMQSPYEKHFYWSYALNKKR